MKMYIDASTLTDENIGSIGRIVINVINELKNYSNVDIVLLTDVEISSNILSNFKNINNIIYKGKKNKNIFDFIESYLPWVYNILSKKKDVDLFWEPQNYLLKSFENFRTIVTIHDVFPLEVIANRNIIKKKVFYYLIKKTLHNATFIQTPSVFTKNRIDFFWGKNNNILPINNGVETKIFSYRTVDEKDIEYRYALFIGRISYWKGVDFLLDIAEDFFRETSLKIVLTGAMTDDNLKIKLKKLEDKDVVKYLGFISDEYKNYLIQKTDLFLYPSRYDGFGHPPLEAILYDKDVIMSDIDVLKEVTNNLGCYFKIGSKKSFFNAIENISKNNFKKNELKKHVNMLTWENYVKKFYDNFINKDFV